MIGSFLKARKEDVRIPLHINGEEIGEAIRFAVKEIDGVEYIEILGRFNIHISDEIFLLKPHSSIFHQICGY
jgi:hypothetical protein